MRADSVNRDTGGASIQPRVAVPQGGYQVRARSIRPIPPDETIVCVVWSYRLRIPGRIPLTRASLNHMISNSGIAKQKGSNWVDSVIKSIQCLSPTFKASNMLSEAEAAYVTYNKAQAA